MFFSEDGAQPLCKLKKPEVINISPWGYPKSKISCHGWPWQLVVNWWLEDNPFLWRNAWDDPTVSETPMVFPMVFGFTWHFFMFFFSLGEVPIIPSRHHTRWCPPPVMWTLVLTIINHIMKHYYPLLTRINGHFRNWGTLYQVSCEKKWVFPLPKRRAFFARPGRKAEVQPSSTQLLRPWVNGESSRICWWIFHDFVGFYDEKKLGFGGFYGEDWWILWWFNRI